jgi:hypothetical protein
MPRVGAPILDALVKLRVASPSGGDDAPRMTQASATHEAATNTLLHAASIDAGAGPWGLEVVIQRGDETSSAQVPLSIVPARSRLREYWPHVLLPPAVTLVFVLHQFLVEPERASA